MSKENNRLTFLQFYFSLNGRIGRSDFIVGMVGVFAAILVFIFIF